MVFDNIGNKSRYAGLGARVAKGLAAIVSHHGMPPGRYPVDGDDVYLLVQHYETVPASKRKWEAHQKYIDIQYIEHGDELMGFADAKQLTVDTVYDPAVEAELYTGGGNMLKMADGDFVVFYPGEPHMPGVAAAGPSGVRKIIVKIKA